MIKVQTLNDDSFEISWNPNDPVEAKLNDFTANDFITIIEVILKEYQQKM